MDAVIVGLGGKTSDVGDTMLTDGTNNVMAAMKEKGCKRLVVITVSDFMFREEWCLCVFQNVKKSHFM